MLPDFLQANAVPARLVRCDKPVATALAAASALGVPPTRVAKTIVFLLDAQKPVLVVIQGPLRIDPQKVAALFESEACRAASPMDVEDITGYAPGEVPPVSVYGVPTVLDHGLFESPDEPLYCGGGRKDTLLEITPAQIEAYAFEPRRADVAQK